MPRLAPAVITAVSAALAATLLVPAGCGRDDRPVLAFTAGPDGQPTAPRERFQPLADYLAEALGVRVAYVPVRDERTALARFRDGDVQLAWFGGLAGVQARDAVPGARAIAQGATDPNAYSYFIAHASTGLERGGRFPEALADLAFTFGPERSTSGRLMPEYFIRQFAGRGPDAFFAKPYGFSGGHDETIALVASGRYQAGVVDSRVYDRRVREGDADSDVVRVIWRTPYFADDSFTAHPDLEAAFGEGFIARLQAALVAIDDPAILASLGRGRLIPARNAEFAGIAAVARELGLVR